MWEKKEKRELVAGSGDRKFGEIRRCTQNEYQAFYIKRFYYILIRNGNPHLTEEDTRHSSSLSTLTSHRQTLPSLSEANTFVFSLIAS
ncbi:hypothetical protein E2C01_082639 [Portunus trituberculatus]|uniref:Uncharacterized protein n=1 Tax=Portunus trituberculatus TaxID=210409 RepID=A0A5B7J1D6_PORTR|nr:hypothetical protein [Portunus trituberculatus]